MMELDEKAAWKKHNLAAELADDPQLKALFIKPRDEEEVHADYLSVEYKKLAKMLES
jgi:hypothetical protein